MQSSDGEYDDSDEGEELYGKSMFVKDLMNKPHSTRGSARRPQFEGITGTPDERCLKGLNLIQKVTHYFLLF